MVLYRLCDEWVSTKPRVTEGDVCFLMGSFCFIIALYSSTSSTIARIGDFSSSQMYSFGYLPPCPQGEQPPPPERELRETNEKLIFKTTMLARIIGALD